MRGYNNSIIVRVMSVGLVCVELLVVGEVRVRSNKCSEGYINRCMEGFIKKISNRC